MSSLGGHTPHPRGVARRSTSGRPRRFGFSWLRGTTDLAGGTTRTACLSASLTHSARPPASEARTHVPWYVTYVAYGAFFVWCR